MEKPISIIVTETKQNILDVINSSNVHPIILEMILKDIYIDVQHLAVSYADRENKEYNKKLSESTQ